MGIFSSYAIIGFWALIISYLGNKPHGYWDRKDN